MTLRGSLAPSCVFNTLVTDYSNGYFLRTELSPVVAAFLDLKNSPDSLDDVSDYSDSLQSDTHVCYCTLLVYRCAHCIEFYRLLVKEKQSSKRRGVVVVIHSIASLPISRHPVQKPPLHQLLRHLRTIRCLTCPPLPATTVCLTER